jgi:hypothetical protein
MKDKKYHTVSTILKSNIKIVALWAQNYPLGENNVLFFAFQTSDFKILKHK